jgi:hypothetical protein
MRWRKTTIIRWVWLAPAGSRPRVELVALALERAVELAVALLDPEDDDVPAAAQQLAGEDGSRRSRSGR